MVVRTSSDAHTVQVAFGGFTFFRIIATMYGKSAATQRIPPAADTNSLIENPF
jgi:hypothetical protein